MMFVRLAPVPTRRSLRLLVSVLALTTAACGDTFPPANDAADATLGDSSGIDASEGPDVFVVPDCPPDAPTVGDLPFDVASVLTAKCQPCHQSPPRNHAPFPLMSYEDLVHPLGTTGLLRWQRIAQVVQPPNLPHMPPYGNPQLTDADFATLFAWFGECAPPLPEGTGGDDGP